MKNVIKKYTGKKSKGLDELLKKTQAFRKINHCFESLERNSKFIQDIRKLRKKINIPQGGLTAPITKKDTINDHFKIFLALEINAEPDYYDEIIRISEEYDLEIFGDVLEYYVFYASIDPFIKFGSANVAQVFDLKEIFSNRDKSDKSKMDIEILKIFHEELPIAILINPYMSQRDIVNFIQVMYKDWIEPMQINYKKKNTPLGKARKKSDFVKQRNKFIYQNKSKPLKELTSLVANKFHQFLDYTYIQKIIRDMKEQEEIK